MPTRDIMLPNQFATIQSRLAILLGLCDEEVRRELENGWEHSVRTAWLVNFIHIRILRAIGESYQHDDCHGFLILIFRTILFPVLVEPHRRGTCPSHSPSDLAHCTHQAVLLIHPFFYIIDERLLIARLLHVFQPSDCDYTDWKQFMEELTPTQFLWAARWNPNSPKSIGCRSVIELPLISHLGSFYEFGKLDACGVRVSFRSFTSRSIPLTRSELSQQPQHTWLYSIHRDSHLFVGLARHRFRGHRRQTFQRQGAPPKEPCARSCSPSGKSEIDSAESLSRHIQSSPIRENCRES
ncbi:hypothetical protein CRG98_040746 [Punica granatum]|uniref:Uncharacterized protein n=1 Tax=Punica granatum TaxID=22663 RepID=A0A2I0I4E0_PUNGR|nr:hypothetical protein CRG98_040746 [Punica granatum]